MRGRPPTRRMELLELLADGEWHRMDTILWKKYRSVVNDTPPGLIRKRPSMTFGQKGWPQPELQITSFGAKALHEWKGSTRNQPRKEQI